MLSGYVSRTEKPALFLCLAGVRMLRVLHLKYSFQSYNKYLTTNYITKNLEVYRFWLCSQEIMFISMEERQRKCKFLSCWSCLFYFCRWLWKLYFEVVWLWMLCFHHRRLVKSHQLAFAPSELFFSRFSCCYHILPPGHGRNFFLYTLCCKGRETLM